MFSVLAILLILFLHFFNFLLALASSFCSSS
jgi:hypothetical protein